jgi:transposase
VGYIETENKHQTILMPNKLDNYITQENPTRLNDAFVNSLNLKQLGFTKTTPPKEAKPAYPPETLLKLYIYGYYNKIRSSRKLERETHNSLEAIWLCQKLTPDHNTIANFRKDNVKPLKTTFKEYNLLCDKLNLFGKETQSIDGSKFKAVNSKTNNFTLTKLDDRIKRIDTNIEKYLNQLEKNDQKEKEQNKRKFTKEEIQQKIHELKQRKTKYETYKEKLEQTNQPQISLIDPEAKLMKFKEGFGVAYNVQTAIDSKHHLISDFKVTNKPTDNGLIKTVAEGVKEEFGLEVIETIQDKGYRDKVDMVACLENGIIPNVYPPKGLDCYELETVYEHVEVTEERKCSFKSLDIKACLRAGVVPKVYEGLVEVTKVVDAVKFVSKPVDTEVFDSEMVMVEKAKEGFFVRDLVHNVVFCPGGERFRVCGHGRRGVVRYCNKAACERCLRKCCDSRFYRVSFCEGQTLVGCRFFGYGVAGTKVRQSLGVVRVVRFRFFPDVVKLDGRKCLSEHPFGSVKFWNDGSYLLLRGIEKVTGELSLSFLVYNMKRAINVLGVDRLMKAFVLQKSLFFSIFFCRH